MFGTWTEVSFSSSWVWCWKQPSDMTAHDHSRVNRMTPQLRKWDHLRSTWMHHQNWVFARKKWLKDQYQDISWSAEHKEVAEEMKWCQVTLEKIYDCLKSLFKSDKAGWVIKDWKQEDLMKYIPDDQLMINMVWFIFCWSTQTAESSWFPLNSTWFCCVFTLTHWELMILMLFGKCWTTP